jgi:hypothetical protein
MQAHLKQGHTLAYIFWRILEEQMRREILNTIANCGLASFPDPTLKRGRRSVTILGCAESAFLVFSKPMLLLNIT